MAENEDKIQNLITLGTAIGAGFQNCQIYQIGNTYGTLGLNGSLPLDSFTVPENVYKLIVIAVGGGGSGGNSNGNTQGGGGGGAGGGFILITPILPFTIIPLSVGAGGPYLFNGSGAYTGKQSESNGQNTTILGLTATGGTGVPGQITNGQLGGTVTGTTPPGGILIPLYGQPGNSAMQIDNGLSQLGGNGGSTIFGGGGLSQYGTSYPGSPNTGGGGAGGASGTSGAPGGSGQIIIFW